MTSKRLPNEIYDELKLKISELSTLIKSSYLLHATVHQFPLAEIDSEGKDQVFADIDTIALTTHHGTSALDLYCDYLKPQSKKDGISSLSARRLAGIIHITGNNNWKSEINAKLTTVHDLKNEFKDAMMSQAATKYERQRLLATFAPELLLLTAYRRFQYFSVDERVSKIYFSWITEGTTYENQPYKEVISRIEKLNKRKIELGCNVSFDSLMEMDKARLSSSKSYTLIRPTKTHAVMQAKLFDSGKVLQPMKVSLPILLLQPDKLESYDQLEDFDIFTHKKRKYRRKSELVPVLPEYNLFV